MKIKLIDITDINSFIVGGEFYEGDIEVKQGRYNVNGKSLLGLCSLDLTQPMDVVFNTTNKRVEEDFYKFIRKWKVN